MSKTRFQCGRIPPILTLITACSMIGGCSNESAQSDTQVPPGGQAKGQNEDDRGVYKAQNSRFKSSNIKTH